MLQRNNKKRRGAKKKRRLHNPFFEMIKKNKSVISAYLFEVESSQIPCACRSRCLIYGPPSVAQRLVGIGTSPAPPTGSGPSIGRTFTQPPAPGAIDLCALNIGPADPSAFLKNVLSRQNQCFLGLVKAAASKAKRNIWNNTHL